MKYEVVLNGKKYEVEVEEGSAVILNESAYTAPAPAAAPAPTAAPAPAAVPVASGTGTAVEAPMPGTILSIKVTNGQSVKKGDVLIILEAMKMENEITAACDGTVSAIAVTNGQTVDSGTPLVYIA